MKLRNSYRQVPAILMTLGVVACGGSGGNLGQIKQDFESPSGSTKDTQGVTAAAAAQDQFNDTGVNGIVGAGFSGLGLRAEGKLPNEFSALAPHNLFAPHFRLVRDWRAGKRSFNLDVDADASGGVDANATFSACFEDDEEFKAKGEEFARALLSGGEASLSISRSIDLSSCGGAGYTGTLDFDLSIDAKISESSSVINANVSLDFHNVCQSASGGCLTGSIAEEISAEGSGGLSGDVDSGKLSFTMAWNFTASVNRNGTLETIVSKGGARVKAQGTSDGEGSASVEYLFYVKDSSGKEVSYVLVATSSSTGEATLSIRGSDGSLTCSRMSDGSGMCSGTVDGVSYNSSWDAEAYASARESNSNS